MDRPWYPPFRPSPGLHGQAREAALERYGATTTGPVVIEVSGGGATPSDADVLERMARRLAPLGRALVVQGVAPPPAFGAARNPALSRRRDARPARPGAGGVAHEGWTPAIPAE